MKCFKWRFFLSRPTWNSASIKSLKNIYLFLIFFLGRATWVEEGIWAVVQATWATPLCTSLTHVHEHTRTHTAHMGALMQTFQDMGSAGNRIHTHQTHRHTRTHVHMHVHSHTAHTRMQMFQDNGKIEITAPPSTHSPTWALCLSSTLFAKRYFSLNIIHLLEPPEMSCDIEIPPPPCRQF